MSAAFGVEVFKNEWRNYQYTGFQSLYLRLLRYNLVIGLEKLVLHLK